MSKHSSGGMPIKFGKSLMKTTFMSRAHVPAMKQSAEPDAICSLATRALARKTKEKIDKLAADIQQFLSVMQVFMNVLNI